MLEAGARLAENVRDWAMYRRWSLRSPFARLRPPNAIMCCRCASSTSPWEGRSCDSSGSISFGLQKTGRGVASRSMLEEHWSHHHVARNLRKLDLQKPLARQCKL